MSQVRESKNQSEARRETRTMREIAADPNLTGTEAAWECFRQYARERPEMVAIWSFGIGFVLGWKLRLF